MAKKTIEKKRRANGKSTYVLDTVVRLALSGKTGVIATAAGNVVVRSATAIENEATKREQTERGRDIKDLYYLDEMIADMIKETQFNPANTGGWKYTTFLRDWYRELYEKVGHTAEEREAHLRKNFGDEWYERGEFLTEEQIAEIIE